MGMAQISWIAMAGKMRQYGSGFLMPPTSLAKPIFMSGMTAKFTCMITLFKSEDVSDEVERTTG